MDFKLSHLFEHQTKFHSLLKFLFLLVIVVAYFAFVSYKYGTSNGLAITLLTWSFFVFCTPIADAGFLLDFPIRIITGIRMVYSEMFVWLFAFLLNLYFLIFDPSIYQKTMVLQLFYQIITHPIPFWLIILVSAIGTFFSVMFGDELIDVVKHSERKKYHKHLSKYQLVIFVFLFIIIIFLYNYLLSSLGIEII